MLRGRSHIGSQGVDLEALNYFFFSLCSSATDNLDAWPWQSLFGRHQLLLFLFNSPIPATMHSGSSNIMIVFKSDVSSKKERHIIAVIALWFSALVFARGQNTNPVRYDNECVRSWSRSNHKITTWFTALSPLLFCDSMKSSDLPLKSRMHNAIS